MADFVEELRNSPLVWEKDLGDNVHSFNFSKKAFFDKAWNDQTIRARGLFVDVADNSVVARSYDKFFNYKEMPETQPEALKKNLKFPITAHRKENGFLGILSARNGELFVASKSTNQGEFAGYFRDILNSYLSEDSQQRYLITCLELHHASCIFEVIDPIHDPHIVEYDKPELVLLDIVQNSYEFQAWGDLDCFDIARRIGCRFKSCAGEFWFWDEFQEFLNEHREDQIEGWVFVDENGFMFKYKTDWYTRWKSLRRVAQQYCGNKKDIGSIKNGRSILGQFDEINMMKALNYYRSAGIVPSVIELRHKYFDYRLGRIS